MNEESMSMGKRFVGVLFSPVRTFKDIGEDPRILIPAIIIIALSALLIAIIIPETQVATRAALEKNPQMTADMIEKTVKWTGVGAVIGVIFVTPLIWLIKSALLALFNQLSIGQASFKQLFAVSAYSSVPSIIGSIIKSGMIKTMGAQSLTSFNTSLGLLLPSGNNSGFLYSFLNAVDLFSIWGLILLSIGGGIAMSKDSKKVGIYVFALWLVFILGASLLGANFGAGTAGL